jgi:hypothetical protein
MFIRNLANTVLVLSLATAPVWAPIGIHYSFLNEESKKIENIPKLIQNIDNIETKADNFFSDGFLTSNESMELYDDLDQLDFYNALHDSLNFTTKEGAELNYGLSNIKQKLFAVYLSPDPYSITVTAKDGRSYQMELSGKDLEQSDIADTLRQTLDTFKKYVQSGEYRTLVGPLSPVERAIQFLAGLAKD